MEAKQFGEFLRKLRKDRKMTIRQLELYSGVSNAYLSQLENGKRGIPSPDILKKLSAPLGVEYEELMKKAGYLEPDDIPTVREKSVDYNLPPLTPKDERDIGRDLERILNNLESDEALAFHGEPIDDETKELLRISLENSMRLAKQIAKSKFTPKKYRK